MNKRIKSTNIKLFILSEFLVMSGFGFLFPIIAIFINNDVVGGSIIAASVATTIYLLCKAILRIPISRYCDKYRLHKKFMIIGYFMMALVPIGYLLSKSIWHIYLVEFYFAIAAAIGRSGWYYLFNESIPKGQAGSKWSVIKGYTGIGDAISATVGGLLATFFGFPITFIIVFILGVIGTVILSRVNE